MRFFFETFIIIIVAVVALFVYANYWDEIKYAFFSNNERFTIYVGDVAVDVSVADEQHERILGLSGTPSLDDFEGKLFIFDHAAKHGIWMKDMLFPIDILWFNNELELIHIEKNVEPRTYPNVFAPQEDARFVLEVNAFFVNTLKIEVGDRLALPPLLIPDDIRRNLQQ